MPQSTMPLNLGQDPVRKCFQHFLMPAMTGMVIKSLYVAADIMFIGHSMGEDGLAAINIVLPYFSFMFALAMMVGVGGGALMSIRFGEGEYDQGGRIFRQSFTLITLIMLSLTTATLIWLEEIVIAFGAREQLIPMAKDYLRSLTYFATPYAMGWVLSNFVRNDNNPNLVMKAMIASALTNIILDWLFMMVFHWGMMGAGLATGLAQLSMTLVLLYHFRTANCRLKLGFSLPRPRLMAQMLSTGLPTLFMELSIGIVILVSNWVLLQKGGTLYLSVYSVVLNCIWLMGLLVYGVCQAVQPLISFNYGARQSQRILETLNLGFVVIALICTLFTVAALAVPSAIVSAFVAQPSNEMIALGSIAMRLYGLAAIPMGMNVLVMTIYQAIARSRVSSIISLLRSLVLPVAGLLVLPMLIDLSYIWVNLLIADLLVLFGSLVLLQHFRRRLLNSDQEKQDEGESALSPAFES